jgi:hypothetical protein
MTALKCTDAEGHADQGPTDRQLIALDFVGEVAATLCQLSTALVAATACADAAAVEVRLWELRRALTAAIASWREAVPADIDGGADHEHP